MGLVLLSSWSSPPTLGLSLAHLDKLVHFGMYAVLGGALAWGHHRDGRPAPWLLLAGGILFGVTDELHQAFVPRREPSVADLVADTLGLLAGYAVISGLLSRVAPGRDGAPGERSP